MARFIKFKSKYKEEDNTGFGNQPNTQGSKLIKNDGSFNVTIKGLPFSQRFNIFHDLITMPWWRFNLMVFIAYVVMNILFASLYLVVGMDQIEGDRGLTNIEQFWDAFFFSAQTLTTVGYGRENPIGLSANFISAFECLIGLMSFALITGLLYSRFSRPVAKLVKSENMLLAPYKEGNALMFRLANKRNNQLIECEVEVMLALNVIESGKEFRRFFPLTLERKKINTLALSWTIVHPIDDASPLHEVNLPELNDADAAIIVLFKAFDDTYSQHVHTRYSYKWSELIIGAKFNLMYTQTTDGSGTVLYLDKINSHQKL